MSTYRYLLKLCLSLLFVLNSGCATIILDNDAVMKPPSPDPLRFEDPVCMKLNYMTDDLDAFNQAECLKPMTGYQLAKLTSGLAYYNISIDCKSPIAEFTVVFSSQTRNWWARSVWAMTSFVTLGIVPFYVEEKGTIRVLKNDQVLSEIEYKQKRLTSIFALPKWFIDVNKAGEQYRVDFQRATTTRVEVEAIRRALSAEAGSSKP